MVPSEFMSLRVGFLLNFMEIQVGDYVWWWDTGVAIYGVISAFSRIYDVRIVYWFFRCFFVDSPSYRVQLLLVSIG